MDIPAPSVDSPSSQIIDENNEHNSITIIHIFITIIAIKIYFESRGPQKQSDDSDIDLAQGTRREVSTPHTEKARRNRRRTAVMVRSWAAPCDRVARICFTSRKSLMRRRG